ncbi:GIY-YIG nuclease family protein [bacterium]|nr:GIY-YIG nuclease family protein [bacterium]
MGDILLNDILRIKEEDLDKVAIRFNLSNKSYDALKLYQDNKDVLLVNNFHNVLKTEKDGKVKRGRKYLKKGEIVIGLAEMKNNSWLLFDISKITEDYDKTTYDGTSPKLYYFYKHEPLSEYEKYFGRLIVEYHKGFQYAILRGKDRINDFHVKEILPEKYNNDDFPGYDKVNIQWKKLKRKIDNNKSWQTALENQKGVYLITDDSNGKMYVGSAYGDKMILGRWKTYINTRDGGNKELIELDREHIEQHFWFSILEIFKSTTDDVTIRDRENWWKQVLRTRDFGYNKN